jgi:hypothetical protein
MTKWAMGETCEDCLLYNGDACDNKDSDHYQHGLGPMHPACEEAEFEINSD